jgi:hypothetical protein
MHDDAALASSVPDKKVRPMLTHAWFRDYNYCPCGPLGDGAGALSLRAATDRTIACSERALTALSRLLAHGA